MKIKFLLVLFLLSGNIFSQAPTVPSHMELGNMKLKITTRGREIIQEHVNAIHQNQSYFDRMVDKAVLYFPYISEIFQEEGIPDDFKYLCIQESGFKGDAVSKSDAVGFWQFKDFTAKEVGLNIDRFTDERKHIIYSSQGAARYLKKNYFYLKNWIYTCQSYQQGLGGTKRSVDQSLFGVSRMTIDEDTYWYAMKFLAHIVAYKDAVNKKLGEDISVEALEEKPGARLQDIARKNNIELEELKSYNLWAKNNRVPDNRELYLVMIPRKGQSFDEINKIETITLELDESNKSEIDRVVSRQKINPAVRIIVKINGKKAILANSGDSPVTLALRGGITKDRLLKYNDMIPGEDIQDNMIYYLQSKNRRSKISKHIVKPGESLWEISQKYGIRESSLMKKNRMSLGEEPKAGRILWLRKKRPRKVEIEYANVDYKQKSMKEERPDSSEVILNKEEIEVPNIDKPEPKDSVKIETQKIQDNPVEIIENTLDSPEHDKNINRQNFIEHRVMAGETLYSISRKYDVRVEDIVEDNDLKGLSLSIGQLLRIKTSQN